MHEEPSAFTQAFMGILLLFLIGLFVSCTTTKEHSPSNEEVKQLQKAFEGVTIVEGVRIEK